VDRALLLPGRLPRLPLPHVPIFAIPDMEDGIVARRLREAQGGPRNVLAARVASQDTSAGRVGASLQQEVEVRDRIFDAIQRLQREHIDPA
jgi:hypothetical protein